MGLYEKLWLIMSETNALDKTMTVGYGQNSYKAISESAVLNEVKPLLKKHRVILFPISSKCVESITEYTETNKDGKDVNKLRVVTQGTYQYKIVDIDSGEFEILEMFGVGSDSQDKGAGKAATYAYKILLQKLLCMFSGEDTDNTHSDDIKQIQPKTQTQSKTTNLPPRSVITDAQVKMLQSTITESGIDRTIIKAYCLKNFNITSSKDLTKQQLDILLKAIKDGTVKNI